MEAFLAQVAAAAGKASDQGYSKQGRPPVQRKSAAAGHLVKKEEVRQRSPSAPARNRARNSHQEPNTHKHKTLDWQAAPNSAIRCSSSTRHVVSARVLLLRVEKEHRRGALQLEFIGKTGGRTLGHL